MRIRDVPWRGIARLGLLVVVAHGSCGAACQGKTFAPPVRISSMGVPTVHEPGGGEVRVAGGLALGGDAGGMLNAPAVGFVGDARLLVAVSRHLEIEAAVGGVAVDNMGAEPSEQGFGVFMGGAGVRLHPAWDGEGSRLAVSAGFGLGCGGARGGEDLLAGGCGSERRGGFAKGGYLGLDFGLQARRGVATYFNNRYQATSATGLPTTHWGQHLVGLQFGRDVLFGIEMGLVYFGNREHSLAGMQLLVLLGGRWGLQHGDPFALSM